MTSSASPPSAPPVCSPAAVDARSRRGAQMRRTGPDDGLPVVCLGGGTARGAPGPLELRLPLAHRAARAARTPAVAFHEVRYRTSSWKRLEPCIEDARAAVDAVSDPAGRPTLLVGLLDGRRRGRSASPTTPSVAGVVGLAPWIPSRLDVGRPARAGGSPCCTARSTASRFGFPGVSPRSSRAGVRARARGRRGGELPAHPRRGSTPIAFPLPFGLLAPAPARRRRGCAWWTREVARFQAEEERLSRAARQALRRSAPSRPTPGRAAPGRGSSTSSRPPDGGPGRGSPIPGRRGGCCASPRRRSAGPRSSCCGSRRWSRRGGGRSVWQTELTLHVMWWNRKMRTSPPHTRPVRPPSQRRVDRVARSANGIASVSTTHSM